MIKSRKGNRIIKRSTMINTSRMIKMSRMSRKTIRIIMRSRFIKTSRNIKRMQHD